MAKNTEVSRFSLAKSIDQSISVVIKNTSAQSTLDFCASDCAAAGGLLAQIL